MSASYPQLMRLRKETLAKTLLMAIEELPEDAKGQLLKKMRRAELLSQLEYYRGEEIILERESRHKQLSAHSRCLASQRLTRCLAKIRHLQEELEQ